MPQTLSLGGVNAPRLRILAGTTPIAGAQSWKITATNNRQAAQFNAQIALLPGSSFSADWWSTQGQIRLALQAGFTNEAGGVVGWQTMLVGDCDTVDIEMGTGLVRVAGRDLSALLIDQKISKTYQNQTSSQVATLLANEVGLTPNVAATSTLVGRYYRTDHTNTVQEQFSEASTQWDLLTYLADQEGFDVWVDGTKLNFQPSPANSTIVNLPYVQGAIPAFGGTSLTLHRALTLAKDVEVRVRSWSSKSKSSFMVSVRGSIKTNAGAVVKLGPPQVYNFIKPDLTHAQAEIFAQQKLVEISRHERVVTVNMPGDLTTNVRDMARLSGTGTGFDQIYYIDTLERTLSLNHGFVQTLTLKNQSPREEQEIQAAAQTQDNIGDEGNNE